MFKLLPKIDNLDKLYSVIDANTQKMFKHF